MPAAMPFGTLWLPVVVSALVVWFASALAHMVLKHHKADYRGLPDENAVGEPLRKANLAPGLYVHPYVPDHRKMKDPAVQARYTKGPVAMIYVLPSGPPRMGKYLVLWLGFCLLVSFVAAYVARHTLTLTADGMTVMRITGAVAFAGYVMGDLQDMIWKGQPLGNTVRGVIDAIVYAVLTGLVFRLLWPGP
jgi:hypothetical protein